MRRSNDIRIGSLAAQSNCSVPTIRYYEEIGLLPKAARGESGQRAYGASDLHRLVIIRRCRDFGFSIEKIRALLDLITKPERDCISVRDLAAAHLLDVRKKLRELRELERALKAIVDSCNESCLGGPVGECVIFEDMASAQPSSVGEAKSRRCCHSG